MNRRERMAYHLLVFHSLLSSFVKVQPQRPLASALYIFGDSINDNGNNNFIAALAKANYPPYGIDFPSGATGRFTNGLTTTDIIAQLLKLPLPPPYLSLSATNTSKILTGANYASGGGGILEESGSPLQARLSFNQQLNLFEKTVQQDLPPLFNSSRALQDHLAKAIFVVEFGTIDYLFNYLLPEFFNTSRDLSPPAFARILLQNFSQQLTMLYNLGARKIVVMGLSALGCTPNQIIRQGTGGSCSDVVNYQIIAPFNIQLPFLLNRLRFTLRGSIFVFENVFRAFTSIISNPSRYGFTITNKACCSANMNGTLLCLPNLPTCTNRNQFVFYDGIHPTQNVNILMSQACFNGSTYVCSPINIQQLARAQIPNRRK
ncbi:GDSL esterase/lipase At1g71691 [Amborella trichopoda]|nr:GDSL esterase/lipase At1g71691 [Amborella trichopoda]|eukprot:XP_006844086.2 GDSL esterase/lipase At1g71691 [Amborella trichopoda]